MLLSLLLLLLISSTQASHYYGTVMTYYPKNTYANGSMMVDLHYKFNFLCGADITSWTCFSGDCGTVSYAVLNCVDHESGTLGWCQKEGIMTRQVSTNTPFQWGLGGGGWLSNLNGIGTWRALILVELRNRSDTNQANRSPQTTILPVVRVASNCQRDFNLLAFDPDGDEVKCRYGNTALSECYSCTPPSVLGLLTSCTLSFSPTSSSNEGQYAIQLVMEDFPTQNIILTQTNGTQTTITTINAISKLPVQFVLSVDAAVPSCTEGLYLPKFLPPTPDNRAQLYVPVDQTMKISINAEANMSTISDLLFSGPFNINKTTLGAGQYILSWTPSENQTGESHPICFVVPAVLNTVKYQSELRCVIVNVGYNSTTTPAPTTPVTTPTITTTQTTTTISLTTTPLTTTTTAPTTTTIPSTTTPLTTTTTTPATTTTQTTTTLPSTTTPLTTTITTPATTTTQTTTTILSTTTRTSGTPIWNPIVRSLRIKISFTSSLSEDDIRKNIIQLVDLHYKWNFHACADITSWTCFSGNCGNVSSAVLNKVDEEIGTLVWCQTEGIMTRQVSINTPFQLWSDGGAWIDYIKNGIIAWRALTLVELRNRSDTNQANRSPQTTILPVLRVPSNCQRDFNLLAFDPDGDEVKCRYGNTTLSECYDCTPPSVLNLSTSCTLSFSPTNSSNEGLYAVQLVMEDFPTQNITLTQTDRMQTNITSSNAISKIPVQFVLSVDAAVPSCTEELYLPKFLPPTPDNRALLCAPVDQTLEIIINATANISMISELLFSGPYNINKTTLGAGQYILSWMPSEIQTGESHPICFVVQALFKSVTFVIREYNQLVE